MDKLTKNKRNGRSNREKMKHIDGEMKIIVTKPTRREQMSIVHLKEHESLAQSGRHIMFSKWLGIVTRKKTVKTKTEKLRGLCFQCRGAGHKKQIAG